MQEKVQGDISKSDVYVFISNNYTLAKVEQ